MCGFVAVFSPRNPIVAADLNRMRDRLAHRGPDGGKSWLRQYPQVAVGLGHRRLKVVDLGDAANQPMLSQDGTKVICFNGEIYNYLDLRRELLTCGRTFRTESDTEVLLQAYEEWGNDVLRRLNGMFAFVIWDEARQEALIARDRFGEKPLFYAIAEDGALLFASEMKGLFAYPACRPVLDEVIADEVLGGMLLYGRPETLFRGVKQFPAAHAMWVSGSGEVRDLRSYWAPDCDPARPVPVTADSRAQFFDLLQRAVRGRLRCDVRGTAALSGGLDSSSLVALIASMESPGFRLEETVSARFPDSPEIDESTYQRKVSDFTGVAAAYVTPCPSALVQNLRRLHWHHEGVVGGPSMFAEWCVMQWARANGYTVIIDGQGADEILAGYKVYWDAFQYDTYVKRQHWRRRWNSFLMRRRLSTLAEVQPDARQRLTLPMRLSNDELSSYWSKWALPMQANYAWTGAPTLRKGHVMRYTLGAHQMSISLPSNLYAGDRNAMAHGVEARYPFLDYELVDFCMSLADDAFINNGWQKWILRNAMRGRLPDSVVWRPDKVGYAVPQAKWVTAELREWIVERAFDARMQHFRYFNSERMNQQWQAHRSGQADYSGELWRAASLAECIDMTDSGVWRDGLAGKLD